MQLVGFRVQMFRSVLDSGRIDVTPLTAIVGKNESGKTTLLKALHKFNPFTPEPYSLEREWPRGRRRERDIEQVVCTTWFRLDESERATLAEIAGVPLDIEEIELSRNYKGDLEVKLSLPDAGEKLHTNDVDKLFASVSQPQANTHSQAFAATYSQQIERLRRYAQDGDLTSLEREISSNTWHAAITAAVAPADPHQAQDNALLAKLQKQLTSVSAAAKTVPTIRRKIHEAIRGWLPTFVYMDDYRSFQGTALLDQIQVRSKRNQLTAEDKTFLTIMSLSGLSLDTLVQQAALPDKEERMLDLDDAGATLTRTISDRFRQRRYEVEFRLDGHQFFTFVKDDRDPSLIRLEERSKGFQWFFSFDLMLMHESKGLFRGCVILLDEPGLHLHPNAQTDLLRRLEEYARDNSLIYTTHLPFMLDLLEPERIRVISEGEQGVKVTETMNDASPEGKLVLETALGIRGAQSYLVAQRNLVVEGVTDYWILTELMNLQSRSGDQSFDRDILITPAGGASEAAYIATFMVGQGLGVYVLLDGDDAGTKAKQSLAQKWISRYKGSNARISTLGEIINVPDRKGIAIEDIFEESFFLECLRDCYRKDLARLGHDADTLILTGRDSLVKRGERLLRGFELGLSKIRIAKVIRSRLAAMKSMAELNEATQERAHALLREISQFFA